jgi:DNA-binding protein HU-beta
MNKAELVAAISSKAGLTKKDVDVVVDLLFDEIENSLAKGEEVKISGFGNFFVKDRKERVGTSPVGDHHRIKIPATKTVGFKPSKNIKAAVK